METIKELKSNDLFDSNCYYSVEMIKQILPLADDLLANVLYKRINQNFLDEDDLNVVNKKIEKIKSRQNSILQKELAMFDNSGNDISGN
jgi:hypothetical protein